MNRTVLLLGWVAGGMFLAGLALGFLPIHSGEYACGSAFVAKDVAGKELSGAVSGVDYGPQDCAGVRSTARQLPITLLIVGAAFGGAAVSINDREPRSAPAARGSGPASA